MSALEVVAIAFLVLVVVLAVGGAVAGARRRPREADFQATLDEVNRALAAAHAADNGWEPTALTDAARRAFEESRPGVAIHDQALVQVIDPPGTDHDKAVFRFRTDSDETLLTLGRVGDEWRLEAIE